MVAEPWSGFRFDIDCEANSSIPVGYACVLTSALEFDLADGLFAGTVEMEVESCLGQLNLRRASALQQEKSPGCCCGQPVAVSCKQYTER